MTIYTQQYSFNSDNYTPIGLYLSLRNRFRFASLLESNDYHDRTASKSFIGLNPICDIQVFSSEIIIREGESIRKVPIENPQQTPAQIQTLLESYSFENEFSENGFLSYFSFEFAHFEENLLNESNPSAIPLARFILFEHLIVLDHFYNHGMILHNSFSEAAKSEEILSELLNFSKAAELPFEIKSSEKSLISDSGFLQKVQHAKDHIYHGNVFQLVLSRRFEQPFFGDDFQVYRHLRRLNPSPYLFYIDMESYRLFGSSPETQIQLKNGVAEIHPIAGTVKKTGNSEADTALVKQLLADEKENAEHTMLVDLARNDLSKSCHSVKLTSYKEVQHFSHVTHLVSKVTGETNQHALNLFNGTFPAGTLSGTPKPKALELIKNMEIPKRSFYGGAIGFIHCNGDMNLAIIIRSALSTNNQLHYQAGAGIVLDSIAENELAEINNKLGAIRKAISNASKESEL